MSDSMRPTLEKPTPDVHGWHHDYRYSEIGAGVILKPQNDQGRADLVVLSDTPIELRQDSEDTFVVEGVLYCKWSRRHALIDATKAVCEWCNGKDPDHVDVSWSADRREYVHATDFEIPVPCQASRIHAMLRDGQS